MDCLQQRVLQLLRRFRREWCHLPERERTTVCGADNMILVLQLAMAEVNKEACGEFAIDLSDLLLMWNYLLREKLGLLHESKEVPEGYTRVRETYQSFLMRSNLVDLIDVYKICADLRTEADLGEMMTVVELLDFLSGSSLENITPSAPSSSANEQHRSTSKMVARWRKILCDYLTLMVNAKSDLAMACVFNLPERGLGRDAFTHLRHTARSKQMSLYLAATSFVRCLELGSKSCAPSIEDPLMQCAKGLVDLVHFVDKLQEIVGETSDPSAAGSQILTAIWRRLMKGHCSESPLCRAGGEVQQELTTRIANAANAPANAAGASAANSSPAQPKAYAINRATAYGGRQTVKAFLAILDEEAAKHPSRGKAELLDGPAEQAGPLGLPCMLTLFRSPKQSSGSSPKALRHRIQRRLQQGKPTQLGSIAIRSQFAGTYNEEDATKKPPSLCQIPVREHLGPKLTPNISCGSNSSTDGKAESMPKKRAHGPSLGNVVGTGKGNGVEGKRRRLEADCGGENREPDDANERQGTLGGQPCKKKAPRRVNTKKLIPGQLKLTSFFRV
ncbi:PCNA-interacting partner [Rhinoraja longicauda]